MFRTKVVEEIKTHFVFDNFVFENRAVSKIMWKNTVQRGRRHMTIWRMRIACWMTKAANTNSQYVIFIVISLQHRLHESASLSPYSTMPVLLTSELCGDA
jgi:hypothetical protein